MKKYWTTEVICLQQRGKRQACQAGLGGCAWAFGDPSRRLFPPSRKREAPEEFQRAFLKSPFVYSDCVTSLTLCPTGCVPCFWRKLWPRSFYFRTNQNFLLSLWASGVGERAWDSHSRIHRQGRCRDSEPVAGSLQRGWPFSGDLSLSLPLQESSSGCWDVADLEMDTLVFVGWVSSLDGTGIWELLTYLQNCVSLSGLFLQWLRIWSKDKSHTTSVGAQEQGSRWTKLTKCVHLMSQCVQESAPY